MAQDRSRIDSGRLELPGRGRSDWGTGQPWLGAGKGFSGTGAAEQAAAKAAGKRGSPGARIRGTTRKSDL